MYYARRHDERGGVTPSGARVPHAVPGRVSRRPLRHHAGVLAQRPPQATHLRDAAVEARGLLHARQLRVQGGLRLLSPALPAAPFISAHTRMLITILLH